MKLSRRDRIQLLTILFPGVLFGLWIGLLQPVRTSIANKKKEIAEAHEAIAMGQRQAAIMKNLSRDLAAANERIQAAEPHMVSGDPYRWIINKLQDFPASTNVELSGFEAPVVSDHDFFPRIPYKTASFTIRGTAFYQQFGGFLASFENEFPLLRIKSLRLAPAQTVSLNPDDLEKLEFQLDLLGLIKPQPLKTNTSDQNSISSP